MISRPDFLQSLSQLERRQDEMTGLLTEWVGINSHSRNLPGLERMAGEIQRTFASLPATSELRALPPGPDFSSQGEVIHRPSSRALLWRCQPEAPFRVLLSGHFDTVYPPGTFERAEVRDGRLHGPGAADMKGGILVMYYALKHFEEYAGGPNLGWDVILVPDEETGSRASSSLYTELAPHANVALVFEPSLPDGCMARARKGSGSFNAVVSGRAAHVGRAFREGRNAIAALATFIAEFHALNDKVDGAIFNVGRVDGGGALNVVPQTAAAQFNIRVTEPADIPEIEHRIAELVKQTEEASGCSVRWEGSFTRPPKPWTPALEAIFGQVKTLGEELGASLSWKDTGGCCDGNNLSALGLANLDTLGIVGGGIHSEEEYAVLDSLPRRAALAALVLYEWAAGNIPAELRQ